MGETAPIPLGQPIQPYSDVYVVSEDIAIFIFCLVLGMYGVAFAIGYLKGHQDL